MLKFNVKVSELILDGESYPAGEHEIAKPNKQLIRLVNHAALADPSGVEVLEGQDDSGWQSQEDGEKALAEAMGTHEVINNPDGTRTSRWTGPWQEGQDLQAAIDAENRAKLNTGDAEANIDVN